MPSLPTVVGAAAGGGRIVTSHDEPNEWGFAGEGTAPEPAREPPEERELDVAEEIAVPGADVPRELGDALEELTDRGEEPESGSPGGR
jgi:hypothetical protein